MTAYTTPPSPEPAPRQNTEATLPPTPASRPVAAPTHQTTRVPRPVWLTLVVGLLIGGAFMAGRKTGGDKQGADKPNADMQASGQDGKSDGKPDARDDPKQAGEDKNGGKGGDKNKENGKDKPPPDVVTLDPQGVQIAGLQVERAQMATLAAPLMANGVIMPDINAQASVMPRLAGKTLRVMANIGDTVKAGQTLATIASPDLGTAQEAVHDAGLRRDLAGRALARQQQYRKLGAFGTTEVENARLAFEQTQGEVQTDKDQLSATRQTVAQERAKLRVQEAALAQAQAARTAAEKKLARDRKLLDAELVSRQELEMVQAEAAQAAAQVESARATIRDAQARIAQAEAETQAAADRLANAQKRLVVVARQRQRQEALFRSGLTTNEALVNAQAAYALAAHELEAAENRVRLLGGSPEGDGTLPVIAPIAGKVSERHFSPGEMVSPDRPMFTLLNITGVVAQFAVYQEDLPHLQTGQRIAITTPTLPGQMWQGEVALIGDMLDSKTRTVRVNCLIRNPGALLRPNMFVTGDISGAARAQTVVVSEETVQNLNGGMVVFMPTDKPGQYHAQSVKTGETVDHRTQILSGLNPNDSVVTRNAFLLKSEMLKGQFGG